MGLNMVITLLNKLTLESVKLAYSNQDNMTLQCLGLTSNDAKLLSELSLQELDFVGKSGINCIQVRIDSASIHDVVSQYRRRNAYDIIIHNAIILGASYEVMHKFTTLSRKQYTELRKNHRVESTRASQLTEKEIVALANIIEQQLNNKASVKLLDLIEIANKSQYEIVTIYAELKDNWGHKYVI